VNAAYAAYALTPEHGKTAKDAISRASCSCFRKGTDHKTETRGISEDHVVIESFVEKAAAPNDTYGLAIGEHVIAQANGPKVGRGLHPFRNSAWLGSGPVS
jgi:hypothetical protein